MIWLLSAAVTKGFMQQKEQIVLGQESLYLIKMINIIFIIIIIFLIKILVNLLILLIEYRIIFLLF
ncbi:MAG: hypothetical protein AB4372_06230, partial [Xenococcus sp. (in: cyanobacteria)]